MNCACCVIWTKTESNQCALLPMHVLLRRSHKGWGCTGGEEVKRTMFFTPVLDKDDLSAWRSGTMQVP